MTKIYQASSLRKYNTSVPVFAQTLITLGLARLLFLGSLIEVAHWWGKLIITVLIVSYEGDFNLSTPNGLDLSRGEDIQLLRGVVNNLKERQIKELLQSLKDCDIKCNF